MKIGCEGKCGSHLGQLKAAGRLKYEGRQPSAGVCPVASFLKAGLPWVYIVDRVSSFVQHVRKTHNTL